MIVTFWQHPLSWLFYTPTQKSNPSPIFKIPNKTKQNPKFVPPNPISYPISLKPTNQATFSHFTTQKSNSYLTKNLSTNPKSSLFISTFTDNHFWSKIHHYNQSHKSQLSIIYGGYIKTTPEKPKNRPHTSQKTTKNPVRTIKNSHYNNTKNLISLLITLLCPYTVFLFHPINNT